MKKINGQGSTDNVESIVEQVAKSIEAEVGVSIFTMRPMNHNKGDNKIEVLIVFEDKQVMQAFITVDPKVENEELGVRVRGNFI